METVIWGVVLLLLGVGLAGSVVPLLPGTTLMFAAVLLQKWLLPDSLTWFAVGWIGAFWLVSVVLDVLGTLLGTRLFGGSRWGMAGASGGALAGMFFSVPALLLGTVLGAIAAEKLVGKRTNQEALRSGFGAAVGFLLGTVARLGCACLIAGIYVVAVLPLRR
jgi:uncharacterized protein YqgC (DUF456 family)